MAGASDGDGAFLHCLKERGLGARCGAVNLVCEDELCEDGTLLEFELPSAVFVFYEERCACDVRRHHVWCELDTLVSEIKCFAKGVNELRFA